MDLSDQNRIFSRILNQRDAARKRVAELESSLVQIRYSIKGLESDAMSLVDCQFKRISELEARLESEIRSCVSAHERWGKQVKERDASIAELKETIEGLQAAMDDDDAAAQESLDTFKWQRDRIGDLVGCLFKWVSDLESFGSLPAPGTADLVARTKELLNPTKKD